MARRRIPPLAAALASAGDLMMLWVANARRPELALGDPGLGWLWLGGALGVLAIPFYALGWHEAARAVASAGSRRALRASVGLGALSAALGALIHGLTARMIAADVRSGASALDPLVAVASAGGLLVALWLAAGAALLAASLLFARAALRGGAPGLALLAPALGTLLLASPAPLSPWLGAFLAPAAPNLAHLAFFAVCARRLRRLPAAPQASRISSR
jgi:hypothetical protein